MTPAIARTAFRLAACLALAGCAGTASRGEWIPLIDGASGLGNWTRVGDANWRPENGAIVADRGTIGFLVSKISFRDVEVRAEFRAEADTNSGVFLRVADPARITPESTYEVNIWDLRPDPKYGTGAIVDVAAVPVPNPHSAGGRWNTLEISARGKRLTVRLNGVVTADVEDGRLHEGPIALQYGPGVNGAAGGPIRWRKVLVRPLPAAGRALPES